jgi:hypothetical protein
LEVFAGEFLLIVRVCVTGKQRLRPESLLNILAIAPLDKYLYPGLRPEVLWHILVLGVLDNDLTI